MIQDAIIIFKKEIGNLFRDRRALITNFLLPILMMPIILIGVNFAQSQSAKSAQAAVYNISIEGEIPKTFILPPNLIIGDHNSAQARLVFPASIPESGIFDLTIYLDDSTNAGTYLKNLLYGLTEAYNSQKSLSKLTELSLDPKVFKPLSAQFKPISSTASSGFNLFAILVPYLLAILLVTGSMGLALQVTAGEKENGSLASLLVNQISRESIALGKVFYIIFTGISGAVLNVVGLIGGMSLSSQLFPAPAMNGAQAGASINTSFQLSGMGILDLALVLLCASVFFSSFLVFLGASAKTMKEGTGYIMPLMMVNILIGVSTINLDPAKEIWYYFMPFLNTIFSLKLIMLNIASFGPILITILSNLLFGVIGILLCARIYKSEKVLV